MTAVRCTKMVLMQQYKEVKDRRLTVGLNALITIAKEKKDFSD